MNHILYLEMAAEEAKRSLCDRAQCGSIIVSGRQVIGRGYNGPPLDLPEHKRCAISYTIPANNKHDLTCCIHAEQRAINDALAKHPHKLAGSTLYFTRLGSNGRQAPAGAPYCTMCSRAALDAGISYFVLLHEAGPKSYDTAIYNKLSYAHYA